jgi:zinc protease
VTEIEVSRHEVAGVPVFVVDEPVPVPVLGVSFRVGRADETAPTSGLTHLVEHLVLPARSGVPVDFNGVVDNLLTSMFASGEPDDLAVFLSSIVELLRNPPFERLEVERRTLLAEEATRSAGGARQALALRYGPHGAGLSGYDEYGLRKIGVDGIEYWTRSRFTSENAALWVSGVSLERLDLELARGGGRTQPEAPLPIDDLQTPAVYAAGSGTGICLSFVGGRSVVTNLALEALADGLRQRLRYELGLSYSIDQDTQPLTESLTQLTITADVADVDVAAWLDEAVGILDSLAENGPQAEWLERAKAGWRRYDRDPSARTGWASSCADFELLGRPYEPHTTIVARREEVTAADIADYLASARASLLVLGPDTAPVPPGFEEYPLTSRHRVTGRRHRPKAIRDRLRRALRAVELIVGDDGVSFVSLSGDPYTVLYDSAEVCLRRRGERTLLSDDGFFVTITGGDWVDGAAVLDRIDARVAADRTVNMEPELDRLDRIERASKAAFRRTWLISEELELLPGLLEDDEELLVLAQASRGWRLGLIVLTDRTLRFLYGSGQKHSFAADRGTVSVRNVRGSTLELDVGGEMISLTDITPKDKAAELAAALGAGAQAAITN